MREFRLDIKYHFARIELTACAFLKAARQRSINSEKYEELITIVTPPIYSHRHMQHQSVSDLRRPADLLDANVLVLLKTGGHDGVLNLLKVNVSNLSLVAIKDLGNLLEGGAASLNIEDGDEDEFEEDPALVDVST